MEERTGGAVTINLFEDAQLGNERDNIEESRWHHPDVPADTGYVANLLKDYNILQLPFIFRDYDHLNKVLGGEIVAAMDEKLIEQTGSVPWGGIRTACVTS